jgi:phenylpropionate dioxygenase-like ring-hydroxylating dioxygenase large terminal subunit
MGKKVSRRDFARTTVAAGAAVVALPTSVLGKTAAAAAATVTPATAAGAAAAATAAVAPRKRITMPIEVEYGGRMAWGRDLTLQDTLTPAGQPTPNYPGGWKEGTTIPSEYYVDPAHYARDEKFLAEHFWFMVDHHSRIPNPGDYFVFEYGRGTSVIVLRDKANEVRAFHNVCRHRGSRLCQHGTEGQRPTEAKVDAKPIDPALSVVQLGPSGNSPVFRCVYHAWTYDLTGKLISYPKGMPDGFDASQHGLHPAHVNVVNGWIWVSLATGDAPDFEPWVRNWRTVTDKYGTADLKIATRVSAPTKANWKLVLENFRECYHCYPAHTKTYSAVHQNYGNPDTSTPEQRARIDAELEKWDGKPLPARERERNQQANPDRTNAYRYGGDSPTGGAQPNPGASMSGMGGGPGSHMKLGFLSGSMDGKPLSRLLPNRKEWSHYYQGASVGFSTSWLKAYDDHVVGLRFTPRDVDKTDAELFWLVHPDAKEGKDYDVKRMQALWANTYREDRWICENQQMGVMSERFNFRGTGQPYAEQEGGPASICQWYMREVAGQPRGKQTDGE